MSESAAQTICEQIDQLKCARCRWCVHLVIAGGPMDRRRVLPDLCSCRGGIRAGRIDELHWCRWYRQIGA
jgi:hypothetical protein